MRSCCEREAKSNVKRHRDVAVCDECGRLVLGYGNEAEWKKTQAELTKNKVKFESGKAGAVYLIAKDRAAEGAGLDDEDDDDDDD